MNSAHSSTNPREQKILRASLLGIAVNLLLALVKGVVGLASNSLAIASDALNNLTDSSSSLMTIIGTKLAAKSPDKTHPFGYGRIEYMTGILISVVVLVTGLETLVTAVKSILSPAPVTYSAVSLAVLAVTIGVKLTLGLYFQRTGKSIDSSALIASGADAKNDALVSLVAILSAAVSLVFSLSIDAWAGLLISLFILKTGLDILREALGKILGERGKLDTAQEIQQVLSEVPEIVSAHDLIIHNYGPETNFGSINVELDAHKTVGELYPVLHRLQMDIARKYRIYLVFGFYSVDASAPDTQALRALLDQYVHLHRHCLGYHGLFVDEKTQEVYCDIVLDFSADRPATHASLTALLQRAYPGYAIQVTLDTEFS